MEGKREQSPQELLLAEVLDACMEEQLSFVPPEREIARMHKFSPEFRRQMAEILQRHREPPGKKLEKREFIYSFNKLAACILVLLVVGGMGYLLPRMGGSKSSNQEGIMYDASEPAEAPASAETEKEETSEDTTQMAGGAESGAGQEPDSGVHIPDVEFMGQRLKAAPRQEIQAEEGKVKTLVNSPMIARDAQELMVTIGNMEEYPIRYYADMDLEVQIDGFWYLVPPLEEPDEEERNRLVSLEPGMAQDEIIDLTNYALDYEAEAYRIVTYLDGMTLCAQFQFEPEELFGEEEEP